MLNGWAIEAAQALSDEISVVRCTHEQADILHQQGYYHEAERLYQRCEVDYRKLGECTMAIKSRHMRSLAVRGQGRFIEAKQLCESTIREAHELSQDQWLAHPFYVLALLARDRGNFQEAVQWIRESLVRLTDSGEVAMLAQCHHFLGGVAFLQSDQPETGRLFIARGLLMIKLKQPDNAILLLSGAVATYKEIGHAKGVAKAAFLLFRLYLSQGQGWQALKAAVLGLKMARAAGVLRPAFLLPLLRQEVRRTYIAGSRYIGRNQEISELV